MDRYNTRKCPACAVVTSVLARPDGSTWITDWGISLRGNGALKVPCRNCGRVLIGHWVDGRKSSRSSKDCNDKCMASTGFLCDCKCRGKNHGAGHSA
jgi:hypothetical protein